MLNNSYAPNYAEVIKCSRTLFKSEGEDSVMRYLAEVASYDFKCPDRCDNWACEFYNEHEEEIQSTETVV